MYLIGARSSRERKKTDLHVRPCGPCVKCGKEHDTRWFHGKSLKAPAFRAMQREVPTVTDQSCICQACHTWSRRQQSYDDEDCRHSPSEPAAKVGRKECIFSDCCEPMHCSITKARVAEHTHLPDTNDDKLPICSKHYREIHRQEEVILCFLCKSKIERGSGHRPVNSQLLQQGSVADATKAELASARLCDSCHDRDIRSSSGQTVSSDGSLDKLIDLLNN